MRKKHVGTILIEKWHKNGKPKELYFLSLDGTRYKIARNTNWKKLRNYAWEKVIAWGHNYVDFTKGTNEKQEVFFIKHFTLSEESQWEDLPTYSEVENHWSEDEASSRARKWVDESYEIRDFYEDEDLGLPQRISSRIKKIDVA